MKIKMIDISLTHLKGKSGNIEKNLKEYIPPQYDFITFDHDPVTDQDKLVVFTDHKVEEIDNYQDHQGLKIAWLIEPQENIPQWYSWMVINHHKFDYVMTHHKWLLEIDPKFRLITFGGCWIPLDQFKIYPKTKMTSIIASYKNGTKGHKMRHACVAQYRNNLDVYGINYNYIKSKLDGLRDYRFSVAIENVREDVFFTEKLIDCFATGTVPIYWGCPCIGDFFNTDGIIICENESEIFQAIEYVSNLHYINMKEAIAENMELAKNHLGYEGIYNGIKEIL